MRCYLLVVSLLLLAVCEAIAAAKPPIETDDPCTWSKKPDGTLVYKGKMLMAPGEGNGLTVRQCGMTFYAPIRFAGVKMAFASPQPASVPFEIHDTIPFNYAPNESTIRWVWAASRPVPGNFSCSFEFEVFLPRQ
jgi:hypothetical protein